MKIRVDPQKRLSDIIQRRQLGSASAPRTVLPHPGAIAPRMSPSKVSPPIDVYSADVKMPNVVEQTRQKLKKQYPFL